MTPDMIEDLLLAASVAGGLAALFIFFAWLSDKLQGRWPRD